MLNILTLILLPCASPAVLASPAGGRAPCAATQAHDPRRVVEQFFAAYRTLDVEALVGLFTDDAVFEDPTFRLSAKGLEELRKLALTMRDSFSEVAVQVHSVLVDGDRVATEQTISGVMVRRDGQKRDVRVRGASFFRVRDGRIATWTDYFDFQTFSEQTRK